MRVNRHWLGFTKLWLAVCVATLMGFTFRLYWFAYFWIDDFGNLYWVQKTGGLEMLGHVVNPASAFFRPVGMAVYWVLFRSFDLDPVAYHATAWILHSINVAFVYRLLLRMVHSNFGASAGAALFACQAVFAQIYWNFGTIFEIVSCLLFLVAVDLHSSRRYSFSHLVLIFLLFVLAVKAKEVAITLPIVLALYDFLQPAHRRWNLTRSKFGQLAVTLGVLTLPAVWFAIRKTGEMGSADPSHPYYMDFTFNSFLRGSEWYLNSLFDARLDWRVYAVSLGMLLLLLVKTGNRRALFFLVYIGLVFLPVIFLVNHRFGFYWYLPFFGVSGVVATATKDIMEYLRNKVPMRTGLILGVVIFPIVCRQEYLIQKRRSEGERYYFESMYQEYRAFVQGMRALEPPRSGETILFTSVPSHFDALITLQATQVALRRTDVNVQLADTPSVGTSYQLRFEKNRIIRVRATR